MESVKTAEVYMHAWLTYSVPIVPKHSDYVGGMRSSLVYLTEKLTKKSP